MSSKAQDAALDAVRDTLFDLEDTLRSEIESEIEGLARYRPEMADGPEASMGPDSRGDYLERADVLRAVRG